MKELLTNDALKEIVGATIRLSKKLNFSVVAEGVEDLKTANLLYEMGCDIAQGYYFAKPMAETQLHQFIKSYQPIL